MSSSLRVNTIVPSSGNNVAIGTAGGSITLSGTTNSIVVSAGSTAAPSISPSGDSNTGIFFPSPDTVAIGEGGVEALRVNSSGGVQIANGNLIFSTAGTGIDFSADSNATGMTNELLNDYEQGTWTPVMIGTSAAGTWTPSTQNGGFYVKIGKQVTCWANTIGTLSGATGNSRITGLPFSRAAINTPSGSGNANYSNGSIQYWAGISVMAISPLIEPTNRVYFHTYTTTSSSGAEVGVVNTTHNLHFFVTYYVE